MAVVNKIREIIKARVLAHIDSHWDKRQKSFFAALEGSARRKIVVVFSNEIDLAEKSPVVTTGISYKDKETEEGMDVTKTFRDSMTFQEEDPEQPPLGDIPTEAVEETKKSRKKKEETGD